MVVLLSLGSRTDELKMLLGVTIMVVLSSVHLRLSYKESVLIPHS